MLTNILSRLVAAMPPGVLASSIDLMPNSKRLVVFHALKGWNLRTGKRKGPYPPPIRRQGSAEPRGFPPVPPPPPPPATPVAEKSDYSPF